MRDPLLLAWEKTVRRHGTRIAVTEAASGARVTFAELAARARAWAERHGSPELNGRAVVFSAPNGSSWFEVFLGLRLAGAVVAPLDAGEPAEALRAAAGSLRAAAWWDGVELRASTVRPRRYRAPSPLLLKLTSGSTGAPRPRAFTSGEMLADGRQVMRGMGIGPRDINYAIIPLGHSYGLGNLVMPLLLSGVPLVVSSAPFPHAIAEDFARWHPTVFPGVPALWRVLAGSDARLKGLRLAISAGAPLSPAIAETMLQRHGVAIHGFYGSSETGGVSYDRTGRSTLSGGVGRLLPGVRIAVQRGGRLRVSGPAVFTLGNRRREHGAGAWVMPDRVELNSAGDLRVIGRAADFVKVGGRRVSLGEVAARLRALPGVADAWVAADERGDTTVLGAAVVTPLPAAELRALACAALPPWKTPKAWRCLSALPMTARGKIDTAALRKALFDTGAGA